MARVAVLKASSRALGEKVWPFLTLPRLQGEFVLDIALKRPIALFNNTPLRRKKKYRKAVQYLMNLRWKDCAKLSFSKFKEKNGLRKE